MVMVTMPHRIVRASAASVWFALVMAFALAGWGAARPAVHAQAPPTLAFFTPVRAVLDDTTPAREYVFEGYAHQVVSVIAVTVDGDLDPVVQVIDAQGVLVSENDDIESRVRDAGLEALMLPESGTYTVRVMRYEGANGGTSGQVELTLTPGFARVVWRERFDAGALSWVTPQGEQLALSSGGLRLRVTAPEAAVRAFPPGAGEYKSFYMESKARVFGFTQYAEFGLVLRAQGVDRARAYVVKINTEGQWSVALQDETGEFVLRSWSDNAALEADEWHIAALVRGDRLDVYANNTLLGTVTDGRLRTAGAVGLYAARPEDQADSVTIIFDDVSLTARLGTTYSGLPMSLATWNSRDPALMIAELAEGGHITPAAAHDLFLTDKTLSVLTSNTLIELIGSELAVYRDFVLSAHVRALTTGDDAGCGLVYRWQDERNLDLVFIDSAGGFGVVQARDAALTRNAYALDPMVNADGSHLLALVRGSEVALYINGALVTQEAVQPGEGRVGVVLLNYADVPADCFWSDIWVWSLVEPAPAE